MRCKQALLKDDVAGTLLRSQIHLTSLPEHTLARDFNRPPRTFHPFMIKAHGMSKFVPLRAARRISSSHSHKKRFGQRRFLIPENRIITPYLFLCIRDTGSRLFVKLTSCTYLLLYYIHMKGRLLSSLRCTFKQTLSLIFIFNLYFPILHPPK